MMDNRSIIAIVLIVILWSAYSLFFTPSDQSNSNSDNSSNIQSDSQIENHQNIPLDLSSSSDKHVINDLENVKNIVVSNDLLEIEFSTLGAAINRVKFNKYRKSIDNNELLYLFGSDNVQLKSFLVEGSDGLNLNSNLVYNLRDVNSDKINVTSESETLTFYTNIDNLLVEKSFSFKPDSYHVDVFVNLVNKADQHFSGKINLLLNTPWSEDSKGDFYSFVGPVTFSEEKLQEDKPKNIAKNTQIYKIFKWTGFTDKYFLQAVEPKFDQDELSVSFSNNYIVNKLTSQSFYLPPNQTVSFSYSSYLGPKNLDYISKSDNSFDEAIHFGFFHFLSKPLFDALKFFNSFLNNYGFSIILLTVCIKLLFWPLTHKSYKSMQGMQKLQPEMKRLKEKYANDKQRLNQEMMSFYRDNKVNPLGGCLPILIQIPVFFALYKVLLDSIELRHAPFILWITDLSSKDPYFITPIIMGASMFLQQKLTPTNLDPTQEKVMLMMPVIFTFMFLNFPAGLVIYWLVNNLLTILQQLIIRRQALKA